MLHHAVNGWNSFFSPIPHTSSLHKQKFHFGNKSAFSHLFSLSAFPSRMQNVLLLGCLICLVRSMQAQVGTWICLQVIEETLNLVTCVCVLKEFLYQETETPAQALRTPNGNLVICNKYILMQFFGSFLKQTVTKSRKKTQPVPLYM